MCVVAVLYCVCCHSGCPVNLSLQTSGWTGTQPLDCNRNYSICAYIFKAHFICKGYCWMKKSHGSTSGLKCHSLKFDHQKHHIIIFKGVNVTAAGLNTQWRTYGNPAYSQKTLFNILLEHTLAMKALFYFSF